MIKEKREEIGMTQETLAELAGVSVRTVQRAEKGDKINLESLKGIGSILDISWEMLAESNPQLKLIQSEFGKQAERLVKSEFFRSQEILNTILEMMECPEEGEVLDLACGPGILTESLAKEGFKVTAVDITREMLDLVREKNLTGVKIIRGDANKLSLESDFFEESLTRLSLHHFEDPKRVIEEMKRVTKKGGHIIIGDILTSGNPHDENLHNSIEKLRDPSHTSCLSKEAILDIGRGAGLEFCGYRELKYERELEEWTNISGKDLYTPLYTLLKTLISHSELRSIDLHMKDEKIYFTHTWGFFKFKKN